MRMMRTYEWLMRKRFATFSLEMRKMQYNLVILLVQSGFQIDSTMMQKSSKLAVFNMIKQEFKKLITALF